MSLRRNKRGHELAFSDFFNHCAACCSSKAISSLSDINSATTEMTIANHSRKLFQKFPLVSRSCILSHREPCKVRKTSSLCSPLTLANSARTKGNNTAPLVSLPLPSRIFFMASISSGVREILDKSTTKPQPFRTIISQGGWQCTTS